MPKQRLFALFLYRTKTLILTLVGFILLGTLLLVGAQYLWSISDWVQYLILTGIIIAAFVSSRYIAATPASVQIEDQEITIKQDGEADKIISVEEISSYAYYEELTLRSLKISLHSHKVLSIINFKWKDKTELNSFMRQFELWLAEKSN